MTDDAILDGLILILIVLGIIFISMCFGLVIDLVTLQTSSENATITSVTITIDHYSYNLNASGTTVKNLISNDRYELNQTVNIVLCRGAFSQSPYGAVTIIRGN